MKFLFVSNPFYSHTASLLPIADELLNRGHEIHWITDVSYLRIADLMNELGINLIQIPSMNFGLITSETAKTL